MFVSTGLRCTLASRGSSRSLHNTMRAAFAVVLMGSVHLMKLFRDFRRGITPRCPLSGCLSSVLCRVRSVRLATAPLMYDWAIPASMARLLVFVRFRQPEIPGGEYRWQHIFARLVSFANCHTICVNYPDQWLWCVNRLPNFSMSAFSHFRWRSRYDYKLYWPYM